MMSLKKKAAVALTVASVAAGSFAVPAMAAETRGFDPARLDKAQAEYTQYRYRGDYRGTLARPVARRGGRWRHRPRHSRRGGHRGQNRPMRRRAIITMTATMRRRHRSTPIRAATIISSYDWRYGR